MKDSKPHKGTCGFCDYYGGTVVTYTDNWGKSIDLCDICAATPAGSAAFHPQQYENQDVLKMISRCTRLILDVLSLKRP